MTTSMTFTPADDAGTAQCTHYGLSLDHWLASLPEWDRQQYELALERWTTDGGRCGCGRESAAHGARSPTSGHGVSTSQPRAAAYEAAEQPRNREHTNDSEVDWHAEHGPGVSAASGAPP